MLMNNRYKLHSSVLLMFVSSLVFWCAPLLAATENETQALNYYQKAEILLLNNKYDEALQWYNKALAYKAEDGPIIVEENKVVKSIPQGRKVKQVTSIDILKEDYLPNERIASLQQILMEQQIAANPPKLMLRWMTLRDPTRDDVLDGGETGTIVLNLQNNGKSKATGILLALAADDAHGLHYEPEQAIGEIAPGEEKVLSVPLRTDRIIADKNRNFTITAREKNGFDSNTLDVVLRTRPHRPARIEVTDLRVEDLNGDSRLEPTEMIEILARVKNSGEGVSEALKADITLGENVFLGPEGSTVMELGELYPGDVKDVKFSVITNKRFENDQSIPVGFTISALGKRLYGVEDLGLKAYVSREKLTIAIKPKNRPDSSIGSRHIVDVDNVVPLSQGFKKDAVAVVIGNKDYLHPGLPRVEYAANDARVIKDYLEKVLGYKTANILYVENATSAKFRELFGDENNFAGKLYNFVKPDQSDVFIYYSGHGAPDLKNKGAYFVPVDIDPNYISISGYSLDVFYKNLAKLPAKTLTVVLDTCFSGNSDGGFLLGNVSPAMLKVNMASPLMNKTAIFTSASDGQVSTWFHDMRHGLFTYYFLKGLGGAADQNADGIINTGELGRYTSREVPHQARRISGQEQTPMLSQLEEIVLVKYREGNTTFSSK